MLSHMVNALDPRSSVLCPINKGSLIFSLSLYLNCHCPSTSTTHSVFSRVSLLKFIKEPRFHHKHNSYTVRTPFPNSLVTINISKQDFTHQKLNHTTETSNATLPNHSSSPATEPHNSAQPSLVHAHAVHARQPRLRILLLEP